MLQGAFDYILNLAGELWTMIWMRTEEPRVRPVKEMSEQNMQKEQGAMQAGVSMQVQGCKRR
jgi:hypothetical protein